MKITKQKISIIALLIVVILAATAMNDSMAEEESSSSYFYVNESRLIKCDTKTSDKTVAQQFIYSDSMLMQDARQLSTDLAKASVVLAMAAYEQSYVLDATQKMGYELVDDYNYDVTASVSNNDFVAYSISRKPHVMIDGEEYIIYLIPVRGTPKTEEWFSDFNLGMNNGGDHRGFHLAAHEIFISLEAAIATEDHDYTGHRIIWTMGHSRGAAVANIIAGKLTDGRTYTDKNDGTQKPIADAAHVFGYTYACPAVSKNTNESFKNIYNYNNPGDLIPELPLAKWGYKRWGQTIELPLNDYDNVAFRYNAYMNESFKGVKNMDVIIKQLGMSLNEESDYFNWENQLTFTALAYALGGNAHTSFAECARYKLNPANMEINVDDLAGDCFLLLLKCSSFGDYFEHLASYFMDYGAMDKFIAQAIIDTSGKTDEEVTRYIASHRTDFNKVELALGHSIETKDDIDRAARELVAEGLDIRKFKTMYELVKDTTSLIFDQNFKGVSSITQGHAQVTYIAWINSMYFGYLGWANNKTIKGIPVTSTSGVVNTIGPWCFADSGIEILDIKENIKEIGEFAFLRCKGIQKLEIPYTVEVIDAEAFQQCINIKEVMLVRSDLEVKSGGLCTSGSYTLTMPIDMVFNENAFSHSLVASISSIHYTKGQTGKMVPFGEKYGENNWIKNRPEYWSTSALTSIEFDEGITEIADKAFGHDVYIDFYTGTVYGAITDVKLPSTLKRIGDYAFANQKQLEILEIPESVEYVGTGCFKGTSSLVSATLPVKVTKIPDYCFENSGIETLDIPEQITEIGEFAFLRCKGLQKIEIPYNVEVIDAEAFQQCNNIKEVILIRSDLEVKSCGLWTSGSYILTMPIDMVFNEKAFGSNSVVNISSIHYTKGQTGKMVPFGEKYGENNWIENRPEYWSTSALTSIEFDEGITEIADKAFGHDVYIDYYTGRKYGAIADVKLPSTLKRIGDYAFASQKQLETLEIPESVEYVGTGCFKGASFLVSATLPAKVTKVPDYCYSYSGIKTLDIPEQITEIGERAYEGCIGIEKIEIPYNVEVIGENVFRSCTSVKEITLVRSDLEVKTWGLYPGGGKYKLTMPIDMVFNEKAFGSGSVVNISSIHYTKGQTGKMVPFGEKYGENNWIENRPEYWSTSALTSIEFDEGITEIADKAFGHDVYIDYYTGRKYGAIADVKLPSTLKRIGARAFQNQKTLTGIKIPEGVEYIGDNAIPQNTTMYLQKDSYAHDYAMAKKSSYKLLNYPYIEANNAFARGESQQITANVYKDVDVVEHNVTWSISIDTSDETSIDESGVLTISQDEMADAISIRAIYDGTENGTVINLYDKVPCLVCTGEIVKRIPVDEDGYVQRPSELEKSGYDYTYTNREGQEIEWPLQLAESTPVNVAAKKYYTVTYELNGGNFEADATTKIYENEALVQAIPVKEGYAFEGWYLDSACTEEFDGYTNTDVTLYAKWSHQIHNYETSFNWNDDHTSCEMIKTCNVEEPHCINIYALRIENAVVEQPTCARKGVTRYVAYFMQDGEPIVTELDVEDIEKDDNAHQYAKDSSYESALKSAANCQSKAIYYVVCQVCHEIGSETFEEGELGTHSMTVVVSDSVEATCTEDGYKAVIKCAFCDLTEGGEIIPATNHAHKEVLNEKPATTTESGYTGDTYCKDCGELLEEGTEISMLSVGWIQAGNSWFYYDEAGAPASGWLKINSSWYFFDENGLMLTGWQLSGGKWYYFNSNGKMKTGWLAQGDKWYYMKDNGAMATGWLEIKSQWYYFGTNGVMTTGWKQIKDKWYYFDADGVMATGWIQYKDKWYYFSDNGTMTTSWKKINSVWYYFNDSGVMQTGWKSIDGAWYYFDSNGKMQTSKWIGNDYVDASGKWIKSR